VGGGAEFNKLSGKYDAQNHPNGMQRGEQHQSNKKVIRGGKKGNMGKTTFQKREVLWKQE